MGIRATIKWVMLTMVCTQVGGYVYCTDDQTGQRVTCYQVGQYTYCN